MFSIYPSLSMMKLLVRNASHKSHQVAKQLSMKKEASPNMVNVHFKGKNNLVHIFFYKSNYISSHRNYCMGHANAVNWNGNTNILLLFQTSLPSSPISHIPEWHDEAFHLCENKKWDLFWIILYSFGMLFVLLLWSKEIRWPGIFYHPFSLLRQNGESADFWWFLTGVKHVLQ